MTESPLNATLCAVNCREALQWIFACRASALHSDCGSETGGALSRYHWEGKQLRAFSLRSETAARIVDTLLMRNRCHLLPVLFVLLLTGQCPLPAQPVDTRDYGRISQVPREAFDRWIKEEVQQSGGDLQRGRYHFIIGLSTGHFGQDPVHAIAMRRLAFTLLNNTLAPGDRVTPFAWEMGIWNVGDTLLLNDDPRTRADFVDHVPYAPREASEGGHDIERTLYEALQKVVPRQESSSVVLILLTNSNQSQAPTGRRAVLFGADNRQLSEAIRQSGFRAPPARHSFTLRSKERLLTVDATALLPVKLLSLPGAPDTSRYPTFARDSWQPAADLPSPAEPLPNPVRSSADVPVQTGPVRAPESDGRRTGSWFLPVLLLALLLLVAGAWLLSRRKPTAKAPLADQEQRLAGAPIAGAVEMILGSEPHSLAPLTTRSEWFIVAEKSGLRLHDEQTDRDEKSEKADAAPPRVITLHFDERRRLCAQAEGLTQFHDINPVNVRESSSRRLVVAPGERLFCRVVTGETAERTRLELVFRKEKPA